MTLDLGKSVEKAFASFSEANKAVKARNELQLQLEIYAEKVAGIINIPYINVSSDIESAGETPKLSLGLKNKNGELVAIKAEFSRINDEIKIVTDKIKVKMKSSPTNKQTAEEKFSYGSEQKCLDFFITQSLKYMTPNDRVLLRDALQGDAPKTPEVSEDKQQSPDVS